MGENFIEIIPASIVDPKLTRRQVKDKAADMVVGIDSSKIEEFNKQSSRKNRILNRAYTRYNKKYNDDKFASLSLKEVAKLSPKEQERWFTLNNNKMAAPVFGGMTAIASLPWALSSAVTAPIATALGFGFGAYGSKVGADYGRKIDARRHGLTNNEVIGGLVGGTIGGAVGGVTPIVLKRGYNNLVNTWNSGITKRPEYGNWGGEFIDAIPVQSVKHRIPLRTGNDWNTVAIQQAHQKGIQQIRELMNSQEYKIAMDRNKALAKTLGYEIDVIPDGRYAEIPVQINYSNKLPDNTLGQIQMNPFTNDPKEDLISIDLFKHKYADELETSVFHEGAHHGRYGTVPPEGNTMWMQQQNTDNTLNFYKMKLKDLFKSDTKIPEHLRSYLNDVDIPRNEGLVNVLEIGQLAGLSAKKGYPGFTPLQRILLDVKEENPQFGFIIDALNMDRPEVVWSALTGQYKNGGKMSTNDYIENIKKYLLWNAGSPEEKEYIKNYKYNENTN